MLERKIKKDFVSFKEKIAGENEKNIASLIKRFFLLVNKKEGHELIALFTPNASIESRMTGGHVTPSQYASLVKLESNLDFVTFLDVMIVITADSAKAGGYLTIHRNSGVSRSYPYTFQLKLENGAWKISSGRY